MCVNNVTFTYFRRNVAKCLSAYTFITRAYYLDNDTLGRVERIIDLPQLHKLFYRLYEETFCKKFKKVYIAHSAF